MSKIDKFVWIMFGITIFILIITLISLPLGWMRQPIENKTKINCELAGMKIAKDYFGYQWNGCEDNSGVQYSIRQIKEYNICYNLKPSWANFTEIREISRFDSCNYYNLKDKREIGYRYEKYYLIDKERLGRLIE